MAKKKLSELEVTGPVVAGLLVGIGSAFAIGLLFAPLAAVATTAILVFARYKLQKDA